MNDHQIGQQSIVRVVLMEMLCGSLKRMADCRYIRAFTNFDKIAHDVSSCFLLLHYQPVSLLHSTGRAPEDIKCSP